MYYKEILEVRDDSEKVYFCFYPNSNGQKIIKNDILSINDHQMLQKREKKRVKKLEKKLYILLALYIGSASLGATWCTSASLVEFHCRGIPLSGFEPGTVCSGVRRTNQLN